MSVSLHETCLEYFKRRLSEGWKCVSLEGHNAVLLSPDGIRRELDLRNDVATLRPNGSGDYCNISSQVGCSACPNHHTCVDEAVADDLTTAIRSSSLTEQKDVYAIGALPAASAVSQVKIYFKGMTSNTSATGRARPILRLGANETVGTTVNLPYYISPGWQTFNEILTRPGGGGWQVGDIDSLQIGVGLWETVGEWAWITQVYVEVTYTPGPPPLVPVTDGDLIGIGVIRKS